MVDRIVQKWSVPSHLVLELADLLDDGFTRLDPRFCGSRGEIIVRLGRQFMSYAVEVVDDCGEDHRPSSDECVEATECWNRKGYRMEWGVAHEKLEKRRW